MRTIAHVGKPLTLAPHLGHFLILLSVTSNPHFFTIHYFFSLNNKPTKYIISFYFKIHKTAKL